MRDLHGEGNMVKKIVVLATLALFNSSTAMAAVGGCHAFSGTFVNQVVPCADPTAIVCVDATGSGNLDISISHTVITSFDPVTQIAAGNVTLVRNNGSIVTATIETVAGSGVGVETFTGGTRQFVGVTGGLVATANVPGSGVGTYAGQYCLAGDEGD